MNATEVHEISLTGAFRLEDEGEGIFRLIFDLPGEKVNKLTEAVLTDLERILERMARDTSVKALIVWGGKEPSGTFIAGADIHEIRGVRSAQEARDKARRGQEILGRLASIPAVTIAAIHGNCLGGGTELALACDLRIASHSPKTKIGLPEVQLGIIPGFGGTQRLPRLVGLLNALPVIVQGKPISVGQAAKIGLVDRVAYPPLLLPEAKALAQRALSNGGKRYRPPRRKRPLWARAVEGFGPAREAVRWWTRRSILKLTGGHYPAPLKAVDAVVDGQALKLEAGLAHEAAIVGDLVVSTVSKNLIDIFLSSEESRRGKPGASGERKAAACADRGRIGLLGAGVMGGGIAALLAEKGFRVRMKDITAEALQAGMRKVRELYSSLERKRRATRRETANRMAAISATTDYVGFRDVRFVIEAVVESLPVKQKVFREIEEAVSPDAVLATNTSALPVSEIQASCTRPERVVGLHFFNPVHRMPLVEVVRGRKSSEAALEAAETLARDLGKVPVRVEDAPGFVVNRCLGPYLNEAVRLFEEGYSPAAVDAALRRFGMPMGPFELLDEIGLDVASKVAHVLHTAFGERAKPPEALKRLEEARLLGKKGGRGFYIHGKVRWPWSKGLKPNPEATRLGGAPSGRYLPDSEDLWVKRLILPIVNEASMVIDEKVVEKPSAVDLAMVLGTGFAPFRGGPLRHADSLGLDTVVQFLESSGEVRMKPGALLSRLARERSRFYELEGIATALAR